VPEAHRRLHRWGTIWSALYVVFLPLAMGIFVEAFSIAGITNWLTFWPPVVLSVLVNALLLWWAASLPPRSLTETRMILILSPISTFLLGALFFGEAGTGSQGSLLTMPWGYVCAAQLIFGTGWASIWLPKDYLDPLPEGFDREKFLKTAHDEYQALLWPAIALAGTVYLTSIFSVAQAASAQVGRSPTTLFGVLQGVVILMAGCCLSVPVVRLLGHVTSTRWLLSSLGHENDDAKGHGDSTIQHSTPESPIRANHDDREESTSHVIRNTLIRSSNVMTDISVLILSWYQI
jgi:hypothetical protein